jgi:hypothetical protein
MASILTARMADLRQLSVDVKRVPAMLSAPRSGPDQFDSVIPVYSGPGGRGRCQPNRRSLPRGVVRP